MKLTKPQQRTSSVGRWLSCVAGRTTIPVFDL